MTTQGLDDDARAVEEALAARTDLDEPQERRNNKRLLFAVQLRLELDDIDGLAAEALTDGPDDKSCDLVYVDRDQGLILLAQAYEATTPKPAAPVNKVRSLHQAVTYTFSQPLEAVPERLRSALSEVRQALDDGVIKEIWVWFVSNLPETANVKSELTAIEQSVQAAVGRYLVLQPEIYAQEIGRETLARWYQSSRTPILVADQMRVPLDEGCLTIQGPAWTAYLGTVAAEWLNAMRWQYGDKLFSANVRGFLGPGRSVGTINSGMQETLQAEPGNFWAFNNGISALVYDATPDADSKELLIRGLSIVNGAQTTGTVGGFDDHDALQEAHVTIRFIKCDDREIVQKIIKFNNRQNAMDPADFRSNDHAQRRLVDEFRDLGIDGYTGGRRGGFDQPPKAGGELDVLSASRALAAYHGEPGIAHHERSLIWEDDKLYRNLFSDETTARHVLYCWSLLKAVERLKTQTRRVPDKTLTKSKLARQTYFARRGSSHLLVAAIAESMDAILDQRIINSSQPHFAGNPTPEECITYWQPVVDGLSMLANKNLVKLLLASGPPRVLSASDVENFRDQTEAMVENGDPRWVGFRDKVALTI